MANMSYCRFENTFEDLKDCADHLEDEDVSSSEKFYKKRLIRLCQEIAANYGEDEDGKQTQC